MNLFTRLAALVGLIRDPMPRITPPPTLTPAPEVIDASDRLTPARYMPKWSRHPRHIARRYTLRSIQRRASW